MANLWEVFEARDEIFLNPSALSPHYIPKELPHREQEVEGVARILSSPLRGEERNLLIYGKTGTGKTCVVKHVKEELRRYVAHRGLEKLRVLYVNCRIRNSKYQVLLNLLEAEQLNDPQLRFRPLRDRVSLRGMSTSELYDRFLRVVSSNSLSVVAVLDEVDVVRDLSDLIYILTRINDELKEGSVSLIGITNDMTFKQKLDARSRATLCEEELIFKPYDAMQLQTILRQRVAEAFLPGVVGEDAIALIAAYSAQDGDARYALRLLRKAGEVASIERAKRIERGHVEKARKAVERDLIVEVVKSLPEHQQVVLYAIAHLMTEGSPYRRLSGLRGEELFSGEVYEAYEDLCKLIGRQPRTMRRFSEYLNELEVLGLVSLRPAGKGFRGNTRLIRLGCSPRQLKEVLEESLALS